MVYRKGCLDVEIMRWISNETLEWLLDPEEPGPRHLALRDLMDLPVDDPILVEARQKAYTIGPIGQLLNEMQAPGFWSMPGSGYNPKYFSTVWSIILLAQLGASVNYDERIKRACKYYLDEAFTSVGILSSSGAPSGAADCLQGNMCWALSVLDCDDPRLEIAFDWMARSVTGEGIAPLFDKTAPVRYYAGKCGPLFACGANDRHPCAWGAVKVMQAFSVFPESHRTPFVDRAIQAGVEFLLNVDPVTAEYPHPYAEKPSGNWWKFGFPVFYVTDLLQMAEALVGVGAGDDPRMANLRNLIVEKSGPQGRWLLEYDYMGKTVLDFGEKKKPNKWVTLRALRVLKAISLTNG